MIYDLIVAGAGASGMTAAICATDADIYKQFQHKADQTRKRSVLIIEKNKKIGKKLYATGNGRCNLSNSSFRLECYNSKNEFFPYKVIGAKDYQIVEEALQRVQMEQFADRSFSTLSGGEQQRVILARALAQQTPALILDEPTNHLDITHQIMLMELVKTLDVTVISAIHDLNIAAAYCDRIYILKDGVLEALGTPAEVLTPEMIKKIYKVEAEVAYDSQGKMHILFL